MKKASCPQCGNISNSVREVTLRHHLCFPFSKDSLNESYYYCTNNDCSTAYFSENHLYKTNQLQTYNQIMNRTVCYCFGITQANFETYQKQNRLDHFFEELDALAHGSECHCKIKNPAGRGCLKVFKGLAT